MARTKSVRIVVHKDFFDGWFEPMRKQFEKMKGIPISQVKFTKMIAEQQKFKPPKKQLKLPKELRGFKFNWGL